MAVDRDVLVADWLESVGALDSLFCGVGRADTNALAQAAKLIGIGLIPNVLVRQMAPQLAMFQEVACCCVQDRLHDWRWVSGVWSLLQLSS